MRLDLSHCTASNTATVASGEYRNTLTPDSGYVFATANALTGFNVGGGTSGPSETDPVESGDDVENIELVCTVAMGGENVTTQSFDPSTGEILIEDVTGSIQVTVTPRISPHEGET